MTRDEITAILEFLAGAYERFPPTANRTNTWSAVFRHTAHERVWAASRAWVGREARPPTPADLNAIIRGHERAKQDVGAEVCSTVCMICDPVGWVFVPDGTAHGMARPCPSGCRPLTVEQRYARL